MTFIKTSLAILSLAIMSCGSANVDKSSSSKTETAKEAKKMTEAGYKKATVIASTKEGDCPFTLKMEGDVPYLLDPINLDESYKSDGMKVWVTYSGLRMMNRCDNATPVSIKDIQKRAE